MIRDAHPSATGSERAPGDAPEAAPEYAPGNHPQGTHPTGHWEHPTPWGTLPAAPIVRLTSELSPGKALDLGCGDGRHALVLSNTGWDVVAVDVDDRAIDVAQQRPTAGTPVDYRVDDVRTVTLDPGDGPFDLILAAYLHLPSGELVACLRRAAQWLSPTGELVYLGHARENLTHGLGGPENPDVLPTIADLASAAQGLRIDTLRHVLRPAGKSHAVDVFLRARRFSS